MSALITSLFAAATAAAYAGQALDWYNTKKEIAKNGLAGEQNPLVKKLFGLSPYAALAYKLASPTVLLVFATLVFHDIQYYNVAYVNAPGVDKWAIAWTSAQAAVAAVGFVGYKLSKKN